ncbi:hypothetical protein G8767_33395 [Rhodococcus sp. IC4_135]|uniref:hypothetical protein n=1 Tax=Rhodococcus sp. IC4_135 TaxID=2715537 RepID=UPI001422F37D|nr:hypothetical protein [Rhodococcus sp. IC4_135]
MTPLDEIVGGLDAALSVSAARIERVLAEVPEDDQARAYAHAYGYAYSYLVASITAHLENARRGQR